VYTHVARGMYYGSFKTPRVLLWSIGVIILILMMAIAFLGLLHSPKWFKLNNYNNKNNNVFNKACFDGNNYNIKSEQKPKSYYVRPYPFYRYAIKWKQIKKIGIRDFSTSSRKGFTSSFYQASEELIKFIEDKNLNPLFIYENLSDSSVKGRVLNETRNLSGIYLILNKVTLDYYIGSASTGRFHARFANHLFHFHGSKVVKNAVKKYGLSSFAFIILEVFPEIINKENNKILLDLEDFYLKSLLPNYNILTEAGSSFGYKHSEINRINMKSNYSEERRLSIGNLNKGKSFSPETVELMREAALHLKPPIYSAKSLQNMKKGSKPILVYNKDYTVYGEFPSIIEAAKYLGCDRKTIYRALQSPKKILRRRWIVKYL
jgi:group I intron endonuclease